jgi:hypothetical protein
MAPFAALRVTVLSVQRDTASRTHRTDSQYVTLTGDRQIEFRFAATSRCQAVADTSSGGPGVEAQ